MLRKLDWFWIFFTVALVWALDRYTKLEAVKLTSIQYYGSFIFSLQYNPGAMLGLFKQLPDVLRIVTLSTAGAFLIFTFFIIQYLLPSRVMTLRIGLALLLGGILGNVADRIAWGAVVDFVSLKYYQEKVTTVFNVADLFQWIGHILILFSLVKYAHILWPEANVRKVRWINPRFQMKYIFMLIFSAVGMGIISATLSYTYLRVTLLTYTGGDPKILQGYLYPFILSLVAVNIIFVVALFIVGKALSLRIAGPVYALERYIDDLIKGNFRPFKVRRNDEFQEFTAVGLKLKEHLEQLAVHPPKEGSGGIDMAQEEGGNVLPFPLENLTNPPSSSTGDELVPAPILDEPYEDESVATSESPKAPSTEVGGFLPPLPLPAMAPMNLVSPIGIIPLLSSEDVEPSAPLSPFSGANALAIDEKPEPILPHELPASKTEKNKFAKKAILPPIESREKIDGPLFDIDVMGKARLSSGFSWLTLSDSQLNDVLGEYTKGLEQILKLKAVRYQHRSENSLGLPFDGEQIGFIAQDVQKILPEAVSKRRDGFYELNMDPVHSALVKAVQELHDKHLQAVSSIKSEMLTATHLEHLKSTLKNQSEELERFKATATELAKTLPTESERTRIKTLESDVIHLKKLEGEINRWKTLENEILRLKEIESEVEQLRQLKPDLEKLKSLEAELERFKSKETQSAAVEAEPIADSDASGSAPSFETPSQGEEAQSETKEDELPPLYYSKL